VGGRGGEIVSGGLGGGGALVKGGGERVGRGRRGYEGEGAGVERRREVGGGDEEGGGGGRRGSRVARRER